MTDELKRCEEALEAANRELASLSYSVSHDLRAPLRTIEGFSEALLEDYEARLDDQGRDYLRRIRAAAVSMDEMIVALTELSRLSTREVRRESVDISALASDIASHLRAADGARDVRFEIEPNVVLNSDPHLTRIVLQQLLSNAWKFTSKRAQAHIHVGSEERDGRRVLYVRDDGAGFDPAHASKLFGAFQRLHSTNEFDGAGIGLAIVQRIVNRHHGKVWAVGAVEQGATVYVDLG